MQNPYLGLLVRAGILSLLGLAMGWNCTAIAQMTENEKKASVGDSPADPGPLATDLSSALEPDAVRAAMRKVADWQTARVLNEPSQDWTFAVLYLGMLSASETLKNPHYSDTVLHVAEHYRWTLGPRKAHPDDQAIGQAYLWLNRKHPKSRRIQPTRSQLDQLMNVPDDPNSPVWWWCDSLFMAPPLWAGLAATTHDARYLAYMNHQWKVTSDLLWDPQEHLFFRDKSYFNKREKNGSKVFWSRGNGWVMGGLVRVLQSLPDADSHRSFYIEKLQQMAASVAKLQGPDGLWRAGLLDPQAYPLPEVSGSAFFVYAIAWGIDHRLLDTNVYGPVVARGWAGLEAHIYANGRLGCIQPVGEAPGAYNAGASSVFGVGAFLLAGSEVERMATRAQTIRTAAR